MSSADRPLVVLAAGGSGGHVFPAEALSSELASRGCRLALITDRRGDAFGGALGDMETHRISAGAIAGKNPLRLLLSGSELAWGTWQARGLLGRMKPRAVIGFGGYASVPTMLAAFGRGFPTVLHEQNAILGRANRMLARRVGRLCVSFENTGKMVAEAQARMVLTGMPVRPGVAALRDQPYPFLFGQAPINLLVMGGSQGARVFSEVVPAALRRLPEDLRARLRVSQQCRAEDLERARAAYRQMGIDADLSTFFDDVPDRMASAHLVITRSGASTVAELTAIGRPAILVPYPHAVDDHQSANGHAVDGAGAGWLMPQDAFTPESLARRLTDLFILPATLTNAAAAARVAGRIDAAQRLADSVMDMIDGNGVTRARREAA